MGNILVADIETDGFDPSVIWVVGIFDYDTGKYQSYYGDDVVEGLVRLAEADLVVGHNFIRYDAHHIRRMTDGLIDIPKSKIYDTFEKSTKLFSKMVSKHGLRAWGDLFQFSKGDHSDFSKFSPEMVTYCKRDVLITVMLFELCMLEEGLITQPRHQITEAM